MKALNRKAVLGIARMLVMLIGDHLSSRVDVPLLAGMGVSARVFRAVHCHHRVCCEEGSGTA